MANKYTRRVERAHVAEVNTACLSIRGMLEGFIQEDKTGTITMLNKVRPIDVIESVLARKLTKEESNTYLSAISDIPVELQRAFKIGKIWQDLKQTSRKYLQGNNLEKKSDMVRRYRQFIQGLENPVEVR